MLPTSTPKHEMLSLICSKTRTRCRRVFEHFFRLQSAEVLESVVECWNTEKLVGSANDYRVALYPQTIQPLSLTIVPAFELVDALAASAHDVVHMICESISCRVTGLSDKNRKQVINPSVCVSTWNFDFLFCTDEQLDPMACYSGFWRII